MLIETQNKNLNKLLEKYSFENLKPPNTVYDIQIPQQEYFVQVNDRKRRKIFYNVEYNQEETTNINKIRQKMEEYGIWENLSDQIILKHLYASQMDHNKTLERLLQIQAYHNHPQITKLTTKTIQILRTGCLYTYGKDKNMKPIVIIRVDKFNTDLSVQQNYNAVYFLMLIVMGFRLAPYHAEKYICIIDLNNIGLFSIPYLYMLDVLKRMNIYYCGNVQKTFIFNCQNIKLFWSIASRFVNENARKKITFVGTGQEDKILEFVNSNQLELRYGGTLDNLTDFWPPKDTNSEEKLNNSRLSVQTAYYSLQNNIEYFIQKQEEIVCKNCDKLCNQCNIF